MLSARHCYLDCTKESEDKKDKRVSHPNLGGRWWRRRRRGWRRGGSPGAFPYSDPRAGEKRGGVSPTKGEPCGPGAPYENPFFNCRKLL